MLSDAQRRPSSSDLMKADISIRFYTYLLDEGQIDLNELTSDIAGIPTFTSGLTLANKDNAFISFLSLMSIYHQLKHQKP